MRRRDVIRLIAGSVAWPFATHAQQPMPVIGYLSSSSLEKTSGLKDTGFLPRFRQGLSEVGYVEGRNVAIDYRWAEEHYDRLPALAAELAQRRVAVSGAANGGLASASAAKAATTAIPIS
jgi:putative tryptophan/tyrosine transport system substrate-binding protein